jgi:hypothetical protein
MTDFVATETTWVVLTELAQLIEVEVAHQFTSRQVCEVFTNEAEAIARAIEIGWVPTPEPDDVDETLPA